MASSAPSAVQAFMSIAAAALPSGFQIRLGTVLGAYIAPQTLQIVDVSFSVDDPAELGPIYKHEEHYAIKCSLVSDFGNDDEVSRMTEVFGLYQDVARAVNANPNLNNTVRVAWCSQLDYTPNSDTQGGTMGVLGFEVKCQQRIDPTS